MSGFSIYHNRNQNTKKIYPYILDVQCHLLTNLSTRLVIPVSLHKDFRGSLIKNLNPLISINGKEHIVLTQQMAAIPLSVLGEKVKEVEFDRTIILSAIDFLITGI